MNRRQSIASMTALGGLLISNTGSATPTERFTPKKKFTFCLNTSTISGCGDFTVVDYINIAGEAGYDGVELWMGDIRKYLDGGGAKADITAALAKHKLIFENTIGFAPWLAGPEGLQRMKKDMELLAELGAQRIAAPPVGHEGPEGLDFFKVAEQYKDLLAIGKETGVMPQLEFWGASDLFWHLGQAMMVLCAVGSEDARFLPDIYHLFRGDSDFGAMKMVNPNYIDIFHLNDFKDDKLRLNQTDADRVFPGDGVAPIGMVLDHLKTASGPKVLSLELFNRVYWQRPAKEVAEEGLEKMKEVV